MKVEPMVLLDVIEKSNREIAEVQNRFNQLDKWLEGEVKPTYNQLVNLSKFLRVPFGYLLLEEPVKEDIPLLDFRTVDTEAIYKPSRELIDTIQDMEMKQAWYREQMVEAENDPLRFVGIVKDINNISVIKMVNDIRHIFQLDDDWYTIATSTYPTFSVLRDQLSKFGIIVMQNGTALNNSHRPLNLNEFRAFTLVDEYAPLIFINTLDSNSGKTFSLLHELVHLIIGRPSLYNDDVSNRHKYSNKIEVFCNKVAAELIAPTNIFLEKWINQYKESQDIIHKIELIAGDFKVSKMIIARKALDKQFITQEIYNEVTRLAKEAFDLSRMKERSGGNYLNTMLSRLDRNFLQTLITSADYGETSYSYAYQIAGMTRGVFEDVAEIVRGVR